ncbi:sodium-dependent lysophosphatidylcholine symporter 1 [Sebastes umbrosus]|uniref:sodium-dependent lysophosphatidylcholine symporter 1 n=1 Tax=Sebastes umbrosus TaxID=72105 RepID=UPI00189D9399|nr:sodium-dependent lysophosphatidylcholine symporter 1 [Sebastes umbrosus]
MERKNKLHLMKESFTAVPQEESGGIPVARKVCYAVGDVPYQITTAAITVSLQIFLLDVVQVYEICISSRTILCAYLNFKIKYVSVSQMEASYVSMILFVSRAWDAVTDPLIGYLVSCSNWTPIGKLTPWLILSTPFAILFYLLLWFVPQGWMSQGLSVLWFLTAACLFETLMSCYNVPYLSLNMFLGGDHRDRDSATAYRMSVKMVAMLLASVIQGQVVSVYNTEKQEACLHQDQAHETTPQSTSSSSQTDAPLQETVDKNVKIQAVTLAEITLIFLYVYFASQRKAFLTSALIMGAIFFLCSLVLFLGVKEQRAPLCSDEKVRPPYLTSLKMLICHIPYQRLVLGFVFSALAFQMSLGNFALFCSHAAGQGAQFQHLLLVLLVSASVAVPLWQTVLLRIGKKPTVFIGLSLFIPAVIIVACVPSNLPVFMVMCVLMGFSVATIFLLPWSMLPDVIDDFAVRHPFCKDLEPLFFSCYAFCSKLAGGLSVGISTMTLQFVGYRAGACNHGDGVVTALIVLFTPVPIALLLIGMIFFRSYPINERQCLQLQEQLTTIHPEATSSSPSDPRENAEQPTDVRPHDGATSTSHYHIKTNTLYKSNSSPGCYSHDKKCSVKSPVRSDVSKSPSGGGCHKQRLSALQHSGEDKLGRNVLENDPRSSSSRSNVRSKMSWV